MYPETFFPPRSSRVQSPTGDRPTRHTRNRPIPETGGGHSRVGAPIAYPDGTDSAAAMLQPRIFLEDLLELHLKVEGGVARDWATRGARRPIAEVGRNVQLPLVAFFHELHRLGPAPYHCENKHACASGSGARHAPFCAQHTNLDLAQM